MGKNREQFTSDKFIAFGQILFGHRPFEFDAYLDEFPDGETLQALQIKIREENPSRRMKIQNIIIDIDGTVAPVYGDIPEENLAKLQGLIDAGYKITINSNKKSGERLAPLKEMGIDVFEATEPKPSRANYEDLCKAQEYDPAETIMIGDTPGTDKPLRRGEEDELLGASLLVRSIPPKYEGFPFLTRAKIAFLRKRIQVEVKMVLWRNKNILRSSALSSSSSGRG